MGGAPNRSHAGRRTPPRTRDRPPSSVRRTGGSLARQRPAHHVRKSRAEGLRMAVRSAWQLRVHMWIRDSRTRTSEVPHDHLGSIKTVGTRVLARALHEVYDLHGGGPNLNVVQTTQQGKTMPRIIAGPHLSTPPSDHRHAWRYRLGRMWPDDLRLAFETEGLESAVGRSQGTHAEGVRQIIARKSCTKPLRGCARQAVTAHEVDFVTRFIA